MDTTEQNIKMLEKAVEAYPEAFQGFDRTKNVQDQLQDILNLSARQLMKQFRNFLVWITGTKGQDRYNQGYISDATMPYGIFLPSFEQLWLAYIMHEKYNKVWNGEDWARPQP